MQRLAIILCIYTAAAPLSGCDNKDKASKKTEASKQTEATKTSDSRLASKPVAAKAPAKVNTEPWQTYTDDEFAFRIDAPSAPTKRKQMVKGTMSHMFLFRPPGQFDGGLVVAVAPEIAPKGTKINPKKVLDDAQAGGIRSMQGTSIQSKDTLVDGNPARVFRFKASPRGRHAVGEGKIVLRDRTLYTVIMVHAAGNQKGVAIGERFVKSFGLTKL